MKLHTWYYNTRDSKFQDRWDYPINIKDGKILMLSYIIDAHGNKNIDWSYYTSYFYSAKYWNEDHKQNRPVEDIRSIYRQMLQEILNV